MRSASAVLAQASSLRGVPLDSLPRARGTQVLRLTSVYDHDPHPLADFVDLEALVIDMVPLPRALLAIVAALPALRALEILSSRSVLATWSGGFEHLELLSLPRLDGDLSAYAALLQSMPRLQTLRLPEAEMSTLPSFISELPALREIDLVGVPIPDAELVSLRERVTVRASPISLGWQPGCPGVLRIPDGFAVRDLPLADPDFTSGSHVEIRDRMVRVYEHWQDSPADHIDHNERIHGPYLVEDFIRSGPPVRMTTLERMLLRRHLEVELANFR